MSDQTATEDTAKNNPPKPRFALAVGVVGHKRDFWTSKGTWTEPPSPEERLKKVVADVEAALKAIKAAALQSVNDHGAFFEFEEPEDEKSQKDSKPKPPILTLVSALADGADTIAADAALSLGYKLAAPLPFAVAEYESDFAPAAKADFHRLFGKADAVLELPGRGKSGPSEGDEIEVNRAYEAAGLTVLSQADIVLAVWDRELSRGRGGTAELVAETVRAGIPIVLVDANGILPVEVRWRGLTATPAPIVAIDDLPREPLDKSINRIVDELVRLPASSEQKVGYARWLRETRHRVNRSLAFPALMAFLLARCPNRNDLIPEPPKDLAGYYVNDANPVVRADASEPIAALAAPYGWADGVGFHFAQVFRGAFVTNFFFAAFAVVAALVSVFFLVEDAMAHEKPEAFSWSWNYFFSRHHLPIMIEIGLILSVVIITTVGRWQHWHHRWVEAREVAERLRGALPLWTLGLRPAFFPGEEPTWTGWYTRAVVRMQGLRAGKIVADKPWPERQILLRLLEGQAEYNKKNVARMRNAERRLEWIGMTLFGATALVALDHIFGSPVLGCLLHHSGATAEITIWLSAALPSLATATYGIRIIGDFEGTVHRNEHTFQSIKRLIAGIEQDPPDFALLRARARTAADVLLGDVRSWRLSAESRGLAIPG